MGFQQARLESSGSRMGHVRLPLRISHPDNPATFVEVSDALVDTGATSTCVPRSLVADLNLPQRGITIVRTATGPQSLIQSYADLGLQGKRLVTHILISDTLDTVLIGVTTLEAMGFAVDPVNQRLVESELLLL